MNAEDVSAFLDACEDIAEVMPEQAAVIQQMRFMAMDMYSEEVKANTPPPTPQYVSVSGYDVLENPLRQAFLEAKLASAGLSLENVGTTHMWYRRDNGTYQLLPWAEYHARHEKAWRQREDMWRLAWQKGISEAQFEQLSTPPTGEYGASTPTLADIIAALEKL